MRSKKTNYYNKIMMISKCNLFSLKKLYTKPYDFIIINFNIDI